ncbi:MAG TPA: hypothetical protein DD727_01695, partial [Clostridiales bacterium]|nr:hypothetical protein [Clostridiales bacterium]
TVAVLPAYKVLLLNSMDFMAVNAVRLGYKRISGYLDPVPVWRVDTDEAEVYYHCGSGLRLSTGP